MKRLSLLLPILALTGLSACEIKDKSDEKTTGNSGGSVSRIEGNESAVSVDVAGFKGTVKLPGALLDRADFDIGDVKLPAGSKLTAMDVRAGGKDADEAVTVQFTAPIAPAAVSEHFLAGFRKEGVKASASPDGITGTDDDGQPFTISLTADGQGTRGIIHMGQGATAPAAP